MPGSKNSRVFEFGPFNLNPAECLLLRNGQPMPLAPKAFETLVALVERGGHLIEKGELMRMVWADAFVEEANLARCVHTLRKVLGEEEGGTRYIETVPKRGYRFVAQVREKTNGGSDKAPINSVAVLPFANGGADPEGEALSDGISESLIDRLSELPQLKVIARGSSFKYKGWEADPQEVARALGVAALVTGRVARRGENLVVRVELVDARDRTQIWGGQYNRRAEDLPAVQGEISGEIAERLRLRLTAGERQRLARREIVNPEAYELLLRGRFSRYKGGAENWKIAAEYYLRAIALDPAYAPAYAELTLCYLNLVGSSTLDPKEFTPKAEAAARKALELDAGLISAHMALAALKRNAWDWGAAEQEYQRAFELNPNHFGAHYGYASYLSLMGRHEQAIAEAKHARELDPLTPHATSNVAYVHYFARQYDQAIDFSMKTLELDPTSSWAHLILGYAYAAKGMNAEAIAAYEEAIKLGGDSSATQIFMGTAYAQAGEHERARTILRRLEASKEYVSPGELAVLYGALGERERAFTSLERAYAGHDLQLQFLKTDPALDPLRSDPRFIDLMRRVGVPQ